MTVSVVPTWIQTPGNGSATVYSFPFLITSVTDVVIGFITGGVYAQQNTGFTVSFTPGIQGGGVTFGSPPATGTTVDIRSLLPQTQPTNFANLGAYYPENTTAAVDRLTGLIGNLNRLAYQFGIHGPDTEGVTWPALPGAAARAGNYLAFDPVTGLPSLAALLTNTLTQSGFNGFLGASNVGALFYPMTVFEQNAGAFIANPFVRPGNILRYGINGTASITPMDTAMNFAVASLLGTPASPGPGGEVLVDMAGGPYRWTAGINATWAGTSNAPPIVIRFLGSGVGAHPLAGCILDHSSIGIDCTGNQNITIIDPFLTTPVSPPPINIPQVFILLARNNTKNSVIQRVLRPKFVGYASVAQIYDYGSEGLVCDSAYFNNYGIAGNCCLAITAQNYANVQSLVPGLIMSGSTSMTCCSMSGGQFIMSNPTATSDCIHLEGSADMWFRDNFVYNPGGRSIFYADSSFAATTFVPTVRTLIDGLKVDSSGAPGNVFYFAPAAVPISHIGWKIENIFANTLNFVLSCADANTSINSFIIQNIDEQQSHGIFIPGALTNFSRIIVGPTLINIGSVSQGCWIVGDQNQITVGGVVGGVGLGALDSNFAAQVNGFGIPTGAAITTNFPGATATLQQTSQMVALILQIMKQQGGIAT